MKKKVNEYINFNLGFERCLDLYLDNLKKFKQIAEIHKEKRKKN